MKLKIKDYKSILKYYQIDFQELTPEEIKLNAEDILANKICRCIKKINKHTSIPFKKTELNNENKSIAICTNSIFRKKNLKNFGFTCKKNINLKTKKGSTLKLIKLKPNLKLYTTRSNKKSIKKTNNFKTTKRVQNKKK
jgi:hypothetical protein